VVPNLVTATLGSGGSVRLRNAAGSVHLIADVAATTCRPVPVAAASRPSTPARAGHPAAAEQRRRARGRRRPGGTLDLQVTGSLPTSDGRTVSVPANARAVVLNVTATGVTANTDVRVFPAPASGTAIPTVSNLNAGPGQTVANLVTVPVGAGGKVRLRNAQGRVQLLADIAGYYSAGSTGRFVPVAPTRFLDTRSGVGAAPIATTAAGFVDLLVGGSRGVPAGATAAVLNITGTGVSTTTNVRAYPSTAGTLPTVSNLNLERGRRGPTSRWSRSAPTVRSACATQRANCS
jgi:hypothetical protein